MMIIKARQQCTALLIFFNIGCLYASCPSDELCSEDKLVYQFDLQQDFDNAPVDTECGDPIKESYLQYSNGVNNNVKYDNGTLNLVVTYTGVKNDQCGGSVRRFKTARLVSKQDINSYFSLKKRNPYSGYIEYKAKMPACTFNDKTACVGIWPGLWLFNFSNWKVEHDILEMSYRYNDNNNPQSGFNNQSLSFYTSTESYESSNPNRDRVQRALGVSTGYDLTADYHLYGMRWDCDNTKTCKLAFFFDNINLRTITIRYDENCSETDTGYYYYDQNIHRDFCTKSTSFYDGFGSAKTGSSLLHVILTVHVSNLGAGIKTKYPFNDTDVNKELGRMSIQSIRLYQ